MKKYLWFSIAFAALFFSLNVAAVRVTTLYRASMPVNSQAAQERTALMPQGLAQVLMKVSGNPALLENKAIKARLTAASTLMEEFSYTKLANSPQPYLLQMDFDPDGVNQLLRDAGVATWGQVRPLIVVWLATDATNQAPEIVNSDSASGIRTVLQSQADLRGLPIIFPLMDVTEMNAVSINDVTQQTLPALQIAAKRYQSDAILIGRLTATPSGYQSHWQLVMGDNQWGWDVAGKNRDAVLKAAIDNVTDALAARYSAVMSNNVKTNVTLKVTGINESGDYDQLMAYIKHLPPVMDVEPEHVLGSEVTLSISLRGDAHVLIQAIALGQQLVPQAAEPGSETLVYQWKH